MEMTTTTTVKEVWMQCVVVKKKALSYLITFNF